MKQATRAKYPHRLYNIVIRISGKQKNKILKAAKKQNLTLSDYIKYCIYSEMRREQGFPTPGSAQYSIPTIQEQIHAVATGRTLAQPCGEIDCEKSVVEVGSMSFCETCNIRVE